MRCMVVTHVDEKEEEDENINVDYIVDGNPRPARSQPEGTEKSERYFA